MRNALLKVFFLDSNIHKQLDLSTEYFEQLNKRNVSIRNKKIRRSLQI